MITKEQIKNLTSKWQVLLENINKPKHTQYKFARIYEKIVQHNSPKHIKFLLSVAHRVFTKIIDLKSTKSSKNKLILTEINESELYNGYTFNLEIALSLSDALSDMVIEEIKRTGRFSYFQIENNKIFLIY